MSFRLSTALVAIRLARAVTAAKIGLLKLFVLLTGMRGAAMVAVRRVDWGTLEPNRLNVLCLYRPLFSKDLDQLRKRTNVNWIYLNNELIGQIQSVWAAKELRRQTYFQQYRTSEYASDWNRMRRFGDALLDTILRTCRIDAVMASHIDYWQSEGVRAAAQSRGLPFLVLCRENASFPIQQKTLIKRYGIFRFEGDGVAVFGEPTRRIFVNSGACQPDSVVVTGPPRLDVWRDEVATGQGGRIIILLSYRDRNYWAPENFVDVACLFSEAAEHWADTFNCCFLIKTKNREDTEETKRLLGNSPSRVCVVDHRPELYELLPKARMVIGFNSIALLEALLTDAVVAVPYWGDARRAGEELLLEPEREVDRDIAVFPENHAELWEAIYRCAVGDNCHSVDREQRLRKVRSVFRWPETETCSAAVERFVRSRVDAAGGRCASGNGGGENRAPAGGGMAGNMSLPGRRTGAG